MALSLSEATQLRAAWFAAEMAVAGGQSYTIGDRQLTRADAKLVHSRFVYYDRLVTGLSCGRGAGVRAFRVMPRDL